MIKTLFQIGFLTLAFFFLQLSARGQGANPIIHADVPDKAIIRVGDTYYMSSTSMHMSPGLPIMKSKGLVNRQLVNYAQTWKKIGSQLKMAYTLPHFMGYSFGLFNYANKTPGGYEDVDYSHITDQITNTSKAQAAK